MKNFIDKVMEPFMPQIVARRVAARNVIQAYEAAKPSRTNRARQEHRSANTAVGSSGKALREQARYLDENHDIVTGLFDRLEERIVGGGIGIEPMPLNKDGSVNDDLASQIKQMWAEWSLSPDVSGQLTRPQVERQVCRSWLRDGEVFGQHVYGNVPKYEWLTDVHFALEVLEADYCPFSFDDNQRGIQQGIQRNAWKRPNGYWIYKEHPADSIALESELKRIPASEMIHLAHRKRLEQLRGVSILHPVLMRLAELKEYEESERVAARIAAALTLYIKKGDSGLYGTGGEIDADSDSRMIDIAPGMVFDGLAPGEDVGMIESNRPSALLEGFRNSMLRAVASGTRVGYSTLSRDYNGTYSAQRQELVESQAGYSVLQDQFIAGWSRPVYRKFIEAARLTGKLKVPASVDQSTVLAAMYMAPQMPWIDPAKEADGWLKLVRGGFADQAEVARARGRDPAELMRNRAVEVQKADDLGLQFDSNPAHDNPPPTSTGESSDATDTDQESKN
jgi:lambda family phage portal protein